MKKTVIFILALAALFTFANMALALDTVTLTGGGGYGPYQAGSGGEFTLKPAGALSGIASLYVSGKTADIAAPGTFQSFCVEHGEYISANETYAYVINSAAVGGGVGGGSPDPLSKGAAWLYYQFAKGNLTALTGYAYATGGQSAIDLQNALWYLEDEGGALTDAYKTLLEGQFTTVDNAKLDNDGLYPVSILNLYKDFATGAAPEKHQDVLVLNPVPEPTTMILFGLGLVGLAGLRRKN